MSSLNRFLYLFVTRLLFVFQGVADTDSIAIQQEKIGGEALCIGTGDLLRLLQ